VAVNGSIGETDGEYIGVEDGLRVAVWVLVGCGVIVCTCAGDWLAGKVGVSEVRETQPARQNRLRKMELTRRKVSIFPTLYWIKLTDEWRDEALIIT
jgi:hypothetical protein